MTPSLTSLEAQLDRLLESYRRLRSDNVALLKKVSELEASKRALQVKIDTAATRLESIQSELPIE
jgi:uncharacterized protein (TIGR02449 family)